LGLRWNSEAAARKDNAAHAFPFRKMEGKSLIFLVNIRLGR
jgi:hypothetical protein